MKSRCLLDRAQAAWNAEADDGEGARSGFGPAQRDEHAPNHHPPPAPKHAAMVGRVHVAEGGRGLTL